MTTHDTTAATAAAAANHPELRTYLAVFTALLVLTGLTVAAAFVDLGPVNTLVAMGIACLKAFLVLAWFMHLKVSHRLVWVFVGAGFVWLMLLIGFTVGGRVHPMTRPPAALAALTILSACAVHTPLDDATAERLVQGAQAQIERMLQEHGRVHRFLVFLRRDGTTDLGNVNGGGNAPSRDTVQAILDRGGLAAGADVTFPGKGDEAQVDTMLLLCVGRDGAARDIRVPLGRTVTRIGNTGR